ncbi:MAG TPA: rhodanese-like domain-containing protein [Actinomycetota bacterium]
MRKSTSVALALVWVLALAACSNGSGTSGRAEGWTRLSPRELNDLMAQEDVFLVNVHVPYEGQIPGTDVHIPFTELVDRRDELPTDRTLVLYCRSGNMSTQAAEELVAAGRTGFYELDRGFVAWNEAGLPFEP